jgi:hypothetical protein
MLSPHRRSNAQLQHSVHFRLLGTLLTKQRHPLQTLLGLVPAPVRLHQVPVLLEALEVKLDAGVNRIPAALLVDASENKVTADSNGSEAIQTISVLHDAQCWNLLALLQSTLRVFHLSGERHVCCDLGDFSEDLGICATVGIEEIADNVFLVALVVGSRDVVLCVAHVVHKAGDVHTVGSTHFAQSSFLCSSYIACASMTTRCQCSLSWEASRARPYI